MSRFPARGEVSSVRQCCRNNSRLFRGFTISFPATHPSGGCPGSRLSPALAPPFRWPRNRPPSLTAGHPALPAAWPSDSLGLRDPRTASSGARQQCGVPAVHRRVATERLPRCCAQDMVAPLESILNFANCSKSSRLNNARDIGKAGINPAESP